MNARAPGDTDRTLVIGRTGTGKSQWSLNLLAEQNWGDIPWVIIDYKGEDLIKDIMKASPGKIKKIKPDDKPPKKPGLYIMSPTPMRDDKIVEEWLWKVWEQEDIGLFIDEGYALPDMGRTPAFTAILTQGRTKNIPCIYLYQRPVYMSRFSTAQASFITVFKQGDIRDEKTTAQFCKPAILPNGKKVSPLDLDKLPDYYSLYHDVGRGVTSILKPAPPREVVMEKFRRRLSPRRSNTQRRTFV